uniref:Glycoprotein hormone subunit beta domain-containing protein n=1 Tax=Nothobranchius furzeri TaxID=105023 RepID=A0A8C6NM98_NOTFU
MLLLVLKCTLLCVLMAGTACSCMLKNHTIWIETQNCTQCVAVNTTICSGYFLLPVALLIQRSCAPLSLVYQTAFLPGCPRDVNPHIYYPAARCCSCRRCDTRTHHCVHPRPFSYDQCTITLGGEENQSPGRSC